MDNELEEELKIQLQGGLGKDRQPLTDIPFPAVQKQSSQLQLEIMPQLITDALLTQQKDKPLRSQALNVRTAEVNTLASETHTNFTLNLMLW